jgi:hypothetical protein
MVCNETLGHLVGSLLQDLAACSILPKKTLRHDRRSTVHGVRLPVGCPNPIMAMVEQDLVSMSVIQQKQHPPYEQQTKKTKREFLEHR